MKQCQLAHIDLSAWLSAPTEAEKDRVAQVWQQAFSSHGLIYLTNHGLDSQYQGRGDLSYIQNCVAARRMKILLYMTSGGFSGK